MKSGSRGLIGAALLAASVAADAGVILQDTANASIQVNFYEPVGQSFTAEDPFVSFAFFYLVFNPPEPNDPLQLRLLAGDGLGGAPLGSFIFSVPDDFQGYFDVNLSSIALVAGQMYTAELSVPGDSAYWGVSLNNDGDPYSGGRAYYADRSIGEPVPDASDDMRFRVTPASVVPAPEPGALALLGIGLAGFAFGRRKIAT